MDYDNYKNSRPKFIYSPRHGKFMRTNKIVRRNKHFPNYTSGTNVYDIYAISCSKYAGTKKFNWMLNNWRSQFGIDPSRRGKIKNIIEEETNAYLKCVGGGEKIREI